MKKLIIAVSIPCLILLSMALYNQHLVTTGPTVELPIEGYDPRDILAGHYLRFRIKYNAENTCTIPYIAANMCVKPNQRIFTGNDSGDCEYWISGRCENSEFKDELNRFYIPQDKAKILEAHLIGGRASVRVVVRKGNALIKELLINGRPWTEVFTPNSH